MPLSPGTFIGQYEVVCALGEGGMGEVYRARDKKLNRDVALKVLPDSFAGDPDRGARFEREARVLASLNHPNIAHLYGFEDSGGVRAIIQELVEGPTLAERMAGAAFREEEALSIARQIAEALAAAHERGIVHRDLKPANIKLPPSGIVKVLDFGLAKAVDEDTPPSDLANSPTLTGRVTRAGIILGTAAYMSPEQARGEAVDGRADVWAFGVVLFEMLTGTPLFERPSVAETVAAVLHVDPDLNRAPFRFRRLLRACLTRDPKRRLHDIGDAWLLLDDDVPGSLPRARSPQTWIGWAVAAGAIAAAAWAWTAGRPSIVPPPPFRFQVALPGDLPESAASTISPDGRYIAFLARGGDQVMRVWVRDLRTLEVRALLGTEIGQAAPPPFWSPDSRFIGYDAGGSLKKVEVSGGLPQTLCELRAPAIGGAWNRDGVILFGNVAGGLMRVSDAGGDPAAITVLDPSRGENAHLTPVFLPDGRHFLYLRSSRTNLERTGVFVGSLDRRPEEQEPRPLLATATSPIFARGTEGNPDRILFLRDGNLMAQTFDTRALQLIGAPVAVAQRVHSFLDTTTASASENGALLYKSATEDSQLTWFDRQGRVAARVAEPGLYAALSLSPDGSRAAVLRTNPQVTSSLALWLLDVATGRGTRLSATAGAEAAVWSPDGTRTAFVSNTSGFETLLMQKPTDGSGQEQLLIQTNDRMAPMSWSQDGRDLLYVLVDPKTNSDIWVLPLDGASKPAPFLRTEAAESQAQFAPGRPGGARLVALTSNESGRDEVELRTFPDAGNRIVVSTGGGHSPRWRADGKELFYIAGDGMVTSVAISDNPLRAGTATPLFRMSRNFARPNATGRRGPAPWDVAPDGQKFLIATPLEGDAVSQFTVVLNWQQELAEK